MGRSISPMREAKLAGSDPPAAPRLIVPMSLRLAIPRRVALQQSSPPLHQPGVILKQKEQLGKENPLNGKCASSKLSQPRGSPHQPVLFCFSYKRKPHRLKRLRKKSVISQRERGRSIQRVCADTTNSKRACSVTFPSRSEFPWIIRCGACER